MKNYFLSCFMFFITSLANAQEPSVFTFGGESDEVVEVVHRGKHGELYVGGNCRDLFEWNGRRYGTPGLEQAFVVRIGQDTQVQTWVAPLGIRLKALVSFSHGGMAITGSFFGNMTYRDSLYRGLPGGGLTHFIAWLDTSLVIQSFHRVGVSFPGDVCDLLAVDSGSDVLVIGHYGRLLRSETDTLYQQEKAKSRGFIGRLQRDGQWAWLQSVGEGGETVLKKLALLSDTTFVYTGTFTDTLLLADTLLAANTQDPDLVLGAMTTNGKPRWIRKAGGVFDQIPVDLAVDDEQTIWVGGSLVGVMELSPEIRIRSATGIADLFIAQWNKQGIPLQAKTIRSYRVGALTSLESTPKEIRISAYFSDSLGQLRRTGGPYPATWLLEEGEREASVLELEEGIGFSTASVSGEKGVGSILVGHYNGKRKGQTRSSKGFDGFILSIPMLTPTHKTAAALPWQIYPNPTQDVVRIRGATWQTATLYTVQGQLVNRITSPASELEVSSLPAGLYYLQIRSNIAIATYPIYKK